MMGHSLKLLGLASLNIFVALALAAAYLTQFGTNKLQALTEENVAAFFREVASVTGGKRSGLNRYTATRYFMDHVADDGMFKNKIHSSIPGVEERDVAMDKKTFIDDLLRNMSEKGLHDISISIKNIKISKDSLTATAVTTSREGVSIKTGTAESGDSAVTPAVIVSRCQQTVSLSNSHLIQMQSATCTTEIEPLNSL